MEWHFLRHLVFSSRAQAIVRTISWLGMIAIFMATTAFIVVISIMNGMNNSMEKRILALEPHLVIWSSPSDSSAKSSDGSADTAVDQESYFRWAVEQPGWKIYPFSTQDVIIRSNEGKFQGAIARGVTQESLNHFNQQLRELSQKGSREYYFPDEELPGAGEIFMGIDLARSLQVLEGDEVSVISPEGLLLPPGEAPRVERVVVRRILSTNLADLDAHLLLFQSGETFLALGDTLSKKIGAELWLPSIAAMDSAASELREKTNGLVETWRDRNSDLFFALKLEKSMIGLVLGFAGLISGSSIVTVLAILISHKRRDIAILRTLGLSNSQTIRLFMRMGFVISGGAVFLGAVLGTALSLYLEAYPLNILPDIYYDSSIPADFRPGLLLGVVTFGALLSLGGSYLPAKAASLLHPALSLKLKH